MPLAGPRDDLYSFDPATMAWTLVLAAADSDRPSARDDHGFASAEGKLYVHGGYDKTFSEWAVSLVVCAERFSVPLWLAESALTRWKRAGVHLAHCWRVLASG